MRVAWGREWQDHFPKIAWHLTFRILRILREKNRKTYQRVEAQSKRMILARENAKVLGPDPRKH